MQEFITALQDKKIYNEDLYRQHFSQFDDSVYPLHPEEIYIGFNWNLINDVECSLSDLRRKIDLIRMEDLQDASDANTVDDKLRILKKYDNSIPSNLNYLGLKPEQIHDVFMIMCVYVLD